MDDLIKDFLVESIENLDRLDSELVKLESDPSSEELLSSIFRTIHTIKGSCGFWVLASSKRSLMRAKVSSLVFETARFP